MRKPLPATAAPRTAPRASRFREADVTRAIRGAQKAGMPVSVVEIGPDGSILVRSAEATAAGGRDANEWDVVLK